MAGSNAAYKRISDRIIDDFSGLLIGEALPGERELAEKYSVKRSTVQYALNKLAEQGVVYRIRGKGTFFGKRSVPVMDIGNASAQGSKGISALMRSYGIRARTVLLVSGTVTGNRFIESKLDLDEGEPVFALHRVRFCNDEPFAIEYTYVPQKLFPEIGSVDFKTVSLYEYMEDRGHLPERYDKRLRLIKLLPKEARYLEMPVEGPAFCFELIGVDSKRRTVEYTESYVRCDKTRFSFSSRI